MRKLRSFAEISHASSSDWNRFLYVHRYRGKHVSLGTIPRSDEVALARHNAVLREVIGSHSGFIFKTVGDAFCAAFATASDALAAATAAQRIMQAEDWRDTPIKVRIGLHTGAAEERDGDYFGATVNRVARVMSAAYGQQSCCRRSLWNSCAINFRAD